MSQEEYELRVSILFLKQAIDNFEKSLGPETPLEVEEKKYQPYIPPMMRQHSKEVTVFMKEETSPHKKRPLA